MAMPLLAVPANDIDASGLSLESELPRGWLDRQLEDADATAAAPGQVAIRLSRSGKDVVVRGRVHADLVTPCARCLGPAPVHVATDLSLLLVPAAKAAAPAPPAKATPQAKPVRRTKEPEYELSAEEAEIDTYDGETVVLDDFVREAILLEMPQFPLCSEACPGIRPAGRAAAGPAPAPAPDERELDPRLAPLRALRARLSHGPNGVAQPGEPCPEPGTGGAPGARAAGATAKAFTGKPAKARRLPTNQTRATPKKKRAKPAKRTPKKTTRKE